MKILKNFPIKGKYKKSISTDLYFNQTNKQKNNMARSNQNKNKFKSTWLGQTKKLDSPEKDS